MLKIFIFSYNRGRFLSNCLASIKQYAPHCETVVIDDNSSDQDTQQLLQNLPDGVELMQPGQQGDSRHGGLYPNMQMALDKCDPTDFVLFIQDDMQLVRPLDADDECYITDYFQQFPNSAFLNPVFLKGQRHKRDKRITKIYDNFPAYYRHYPNKSNPRGLSYADVVIGHAGRLKERDWQFVDGETSNAMQAKEKFGDMGFMAHPFVMFLPQVPVYRGKKKSWAVAMAEKLSGEAPKAFEEKSSEHWHAFKQRELSQLPVAEQYLTCIDKVKIPFQYSAVNAYPLLRVMHKLSLIIK